MNRGDVLLARFPHPSGGRGKKRPVVVVQADAYTQNLRSIVVAEVSKNLTMANDPACLFIDATTPEGQATRVLILLADGNDQDRSGASSYRRPFSFHAAEAQCMP